MKTRVPALFLSAGLWLASPCAAENGGKLITEVMNKPGDWFQMCGSPPPVAFNAPVPVFSGSLVWRHFSLGRKEKQNLQANRAAVVPAMVEVLKAMDLTKPPKETRGKQDDGLVSGLKPNWLNALHLQIIGELNSVETLPELLRLEEQLHRVLQAAEKEVKALLPPLDLDAPGFFHKSGDGKRPDEYWESAEYKRDKEIFTSRVIEREMLGTITLLLQREEWPAVKERFAAEHKKASEKALAEARKDLVVIKEDTAKSKPDDPNAVVKREAVVSLENEIKELEAGTAVVSLEVEYSAALRTEIRTMAETFLKGVPPEKRRAAAAMPKHDPSK